MDDGAIALKNETSTISLKQKGVFLGAEITGVDLTQPLDDATIAAIGQAHAEHGLLIFPKQKISSEDLKRFARNYGDLTVHPFSSSAEDAPELIVYDQKEGNPPPPTDIWHTDETFRECPPMGTVLCSKIIPDVGGDTAFISMSAVYEGLSDKMQSFLSGLEAVHDFKPFKTLFPETPEGIERLRKFEDQYPPSTHPIVTVHPVTDKKVLFVSPQFTLKIKGMEEDESNTILDLLFRKTYIHEYQYRHRWEQDMVLFWDNRCAQHSAIHDYYPKRRLMERVTIKGERPVAASDAVDPSAVRRYLNPPVMDFESRQKRQHEL
ncbi:MAG: TauD/TfdA dioxygenase family protein [Alphaproteobacteria bacterium]|jgi:taurine dioxygenase